MIYIVIRKILKSPEQNRTIISILGAYETETAAWDSINNPPVTGISNYPRYIEKSSSLQDQQETVYEVYQLPLNTSVDVLVMSLPNINPNNTPCDVCRVD